MTPQIVYRLTTDDDCRDFTNRADAIREAQKIKYDRDNEFAPRLERLVFEGRDAVTVSPVCYDLSTDSIESFIDD